MATKDRQRIGFGKVLKYNLQMIQEIKVKFELHKELDKFIASQFIASSVNNSDLMQQAFRNHPEIAALKQVDNQLIDSYFNNFYDNSDAQLLEGLIKLEEEWTSISSKVFELASTEFKLLESQDITITLFLSILPLNTRFFESNAFQINYLSENVVEDILSGVFDSLYYIESTIGLNENDKAIKSSTRSWQEDCNKSTQRLIESILT